MGTTYTLGGTKQSVIAECLTDFTSTEGNRCVVIDHAVRGNTLWAVWEVQYPDGKSKRFVVCHLLKRDRDGNWGNKTMGESEHPYYYDCPLKFLKLAPDPKEFQSSEWRAMVMAYHADKKKKAALRKSLKIGCMVRLVDGCKVKQARITSLKPLWGHGPDGVTYRLYARHIAEVVPAEAVTT